MAVETGNACTGLYAVSFARGAYAGSLFARSIPYSIVQCVCVYLCFIGELSARETSLLEWQRTYSKNKRCSCKSIALGITPLLEAKRASGSHSSQRRPLSVIAVDWQAELVGLFNFRAYKITSYLELLAELSIPPRLMGQSAMGES